MNGETPTCSIRLPPASPALLRMDTRLLTHQPDEKIAEAMMDGSCRGARRFPQVANGATDGMPCYTETLSLQ
jgi:hypothetical protein